MRETLTLIPFSTNICLWCVIGLTIQGNHTMFIEELLAKIIRMVILNYFPFFESNLYYSLLSAPKLS